jgi:hypothetical protein
LELEVLVWMGQKVVKKNIWGAKIIFKVDFIILFFKKKNNIFGTTFGLGG